MTTDEPRARRLETFRSLAAERLGHVSLGWIELEQGALAPGRVETMMRELHTLKGEAGLMGLAAVAAALHLLEDLVGAAVRAATAPPPELGDLVLAGIDAIGAAVTAGDDPPALAAFVRAAQARLPSAAPAAAAPAPATTPAAAALGLDDPTSRIDTRQLERLGDAVAELVLIRHRLADALATVARARGTGDGDDGLGLVVGRLRDDVRRLAATTAGLDALARELRMVPVERLLSRFPLVARDLARELGKVVRVTVIGNGVEADRAVLEQLQGPLLHLVRNAVDHGIEPAAERLAAGKGEAGTITIRADVIGTSLRVQVRDDGGGIDIDAVRKSAVERGLIEAPSARILSDDQILAYLFSSGFSTRKSVTPVSGRGVGLDVVRATTEALGGTVTTHNYPGRGTSFVLLVPVSALITGLMLVEIGDGRYALPAAEVRAVLPAADHPVVDSIDGPAIRVAGELVPLVPLPEILGEPQVTVADARLILARSGEITMALAGTRGHRDREAVIRDPGPILEGNPYVRGGIDLEDGSVALVLELDRMVTAARGVAVSARHKGGPITSQVTAKVLVVEDSVIMRDIIAEALRAHGVEVIEAADGVEALAALELHPDLRLLVTDLEMPRMDGFELIRRMRLQPRPTRLPAVVVSTRGSDADKLAAIEVGADAYLVKADFSRESLWSHIARFLLP